MEITIEQFDAHNRHDLNRCDSSFTVDSKLILHAAQGIPSYSVVNVPPYTKHYPPHEISSQIVDATSLAQQLKGIFFAYADGEVAGQIIFSQHWNRYAYVDEIAVDAHFRQRGIGRALIQQAITWTKARQLSGIMLETQNINVGACLFYQRCGFVLGGFDRFLYWGIDPDTEEFALYWYLLF